MRRRRAVRIAQWAAVALAAAAAACGHSARPDDRPARPGITVHASPVVVRTIVDEWEAGGVVTARESAVVSARVVGLITAVSVRAGDTVRAGDLLVTLDGRESRARAREAAAAAAASEWTLAVARSELLAADAEHRLAEAWQRRIEALQQRSAATAQELDEANARLATASARVEAARARKELAEAGISGATAASDAAATAASFTELRAPYAGLVTERLVDPGTLATPGVPLLRIESGGARRVEARVDEARVDYVHPGRRVRVSLRDVTGREAPQVVDAAVAEIGRAVDAGARAFTVKIDLPATVAPRSGSFARIRFPGALRQARVVPASAVRRDGQVTSVAVVQDGTARVRLVQLGDETEDDVEVLAGLSDGELVVTAPPAALVDGSPVMFDRSTQDRGARP